MTDAGFVAAAWAGTALVLGGYVAWLWRRLRRVGGGGGE